MPASVAVTVMPVPAVLGMTANLTCTWSDAFPPVIHTVTWFRLADDGDRSPVLFPGAVKQRLSQSRKNLQVFDLQPSDDARYECVVSNAAGDGVGTTRVVVHGQ